MELQICKNKDETSQRKCKTLHRTKITQEKTKITQENSKTTEVMYAVPLRMYVCVSACVHSRCLYYPS